MKKNSYMDQEILTKFVRQPAARPAVQYLRDIEGHYALRFMSERLAILDVASEVNVTIRLQSSKVVRTDFSLEASKKAIIELSGIAKVKGFCTVSPGKPCLPFSDNTFDGVISIGPYDLTFVDIHQLTTEIKRVLKEGGMFVFSVPTLRSPYCRPDTMKKFRYYSITHFNQLIHRSGLLIRDVAYIFQPKLIYGRLFDDRFMPVWMQKLLIVPCWWISALITINKRQKLASYIVVKLSKDGI